MQQPADHYLLLGSWHLRPGRNFNCGLEPGSADLLLGDVCRALAAQVASLGHRDRKRVSDSLFDTILSDFSLIRCQSETLKLEHTWLLPIEVAIAFVPDKEYLS